MPPVGFKPTISAGVRPQTYALDRAATGIGNFLSLGLKILLSTLLSNIYNISGFVFRLWGGAGAQWSVSNLARQSRDSPDSPPAVM